MSAKGHGGVLKNETVNVEVIRSGRGKVTSVVKMSIFTSNTQG